LLGLILDCYVLVRERTMQRVVEVLAQIGNRQHTFAGLSCWHESILVNTRLRMHWLAVVH
jgi:hypothetical protein